MLLAHVPAQHAAERAGPARMVLGALADRSIACYRDARMAQRQDDLALRDLVADNPAALLAIGIEGRWRERLPRVGTNQVLVLKMILPLPPRLEQRAVDPRHESVVRIDVGRDVDPTRPRAVDKPQCL